MEPTMSKETGATTLTNVNARQVNPPEVIESRQKKDEKQTQDSK